MTLTISASDLRLVAWSHQASRFDAAMPLSVADPAQPSATRVIRAYGHSHLYGVTLWGDELDLTINWRARGERDPQIDNGFVFGEPGIDPDIPGLVSLGPSVTLVDADGWPILVHAAAQAIIASIRPCDWQFPARQYLPRFPISQAPSAPADLGRVQRYSAVSA